MIVCVCQRVSSKDIERSAQAGCADFDELQMKLGVATCCGCCAECAREVFDSARLKAGACQVRGQEAALAMA